MRFWDSSALLAVWLEDPVTQRSRARYDETAVPVVVWWATPVECLSAICRRERSDELTSEQASELTASLRSASETWAHVPPSQALRDRALRALRLHPLRAADALQLAAALTLADGRPEDLEFLCLDERLRAAADREGFQVLDV